MRTRLATQPRRSCAASALASLLFLALPSAAHGVAEGSIAWLAATILLFVLFALGVWRFLVEYRSDAAPAPRDADGGRVPMLVMLAVVVTDMPTTWSTSTWAWVVVWS